MDKKMNNEELQSRREFFKKAAKSALPVVAAVVLAGTPGIATAVQSTGCTTCSSTCVSSCGLNCAIGCGGACRDGCIGTCKVTCQGGCKSSSKY